METNPAKRPGNVKCMGAECGNDAGSLHCPTCLNLGHKDSYFCSQDCFKKNWTQHKALHKTMQQMSLARIASNPSTSHFNPFPTFSFTGSVRPVYPLSLMRTVPAWIMRPDWAETGIPKAEQRLNRSKIEILDTNGQQAMRKVCKLAREVLDIVAASVKPGISSDALDEICHNACIERNSYPSPLNYNHFPKSLCISPNEVVCHGIPDQRLLEDGDLVNLDVSIYHEGYHADLNETYYVGDRPKTSPGCVRLVETTRECLEEAIKIVKPGTLIREFGNVIEAYAKARGCNVVPNWGGHGINTQFHPPPWIPHYSRSKVPGICKPGMTFTIEPILTLGKPVEVYWPDNWTNTTVDGMWTAQFEHTLLVTETGVEVLTARNKDSPGDPIRLDA